MKKKIAILGANEPLISFYRQTKQLGYEIHSIAWPEGAICWEYADYFYPVSFIEKGKVLQICKQIGIDGITSFSLESAVPVVNYISQKLNLPGNPSDCEKLIENKYTMHCQLKKCGISVPDFQIVNEFDHLEDLNFELPLIVKPVDSGGSRGVTKINTVDEIRGAIKRALSYSRKNQVLLEQFIEGREFSVEYISNRGKHYFIAVTDKVTTGNPYFVELEHHQPADITDEINQKLKSITEKTLDALKIYSSASHTEIKMDNKGDLYVIEVGPRMGGDMITSDLVRLSTGYDMVKGVLQLSTGDFVPPVFDKLGCSGIYYLAAEALKVTDYMNGYDRFSEIVSREYFKNEITNVKESNDRSGYFIYQSQKKFLLI